jgi:hypothetical protein
MRTNAKTVSPQETLENNFLVGDVQGSVNGAQPTPSDPFSDLDALRLDQDFAAALGKRVLTTVPVRKPGKQDFIRVHESEAYRIETCLLELKDDREFYVVAPALWPDLANELTPRVLFTCVNRQGVVFLWPVRRPDSTGRLDSWSSSALTACAAARAGWVRVSANMSLGGYDVFAASGELSQPEWPAMSFQDLLRLAFHGRFINNHDHAVLRRLRGEL